MLQGSIEDFTLDEVLGLVATTAKTGELRVDGDRGDGRLWLTDGALTKAVSSSLGEDADPADVVFELLRFRTGTFSFVSGIALPSEDRLDVDAVLEAALARVGEWHGIAEVIPSLDHTVRPRPELADDEVVLSRDDWAALIAIGERRRIGKVLESLGLDEIAGSRRLKTLVERSLVEVSAPEAIPPAPESTPPAVTTPPGASSPVETAFTRTAFADSAPAEPVAAAAAPLAEASPVAEPTPVAETTPVGEATPVVEPTTSEPGASADAGPDPVGAPFSFASAERPLPPLSQPVVTPTPEPIADAAPDATSRGTDVTAADDSVAEAETEAGVEASGEVGAEPPSPSEIAAFGQKLDATPFDPASLVVGDSEENSLLMRYLKSDS